ncbi:MBOAT, membrane-bound O-acyltransferase family-domain-containing protein [Chytriomyces cf. hyalinus JEL632]|nr:MBOAT, membrane-bound O-acyltransferase family-domain-containing protein [Chytriomyces cf. hyalinus JEL632]
MAAAPKSPASPAAVTFASMLLLAVYTLNAQILNPAPPDQDYAAVLMMAAVRLSSFAWAIHDEHLQTSVHKVPSLMNFLGYMLFVPAFFCGPAFDFNTYMDWKHSRGVYKSIPSVFVPALKVFSLGVLLCGVFMQFGDYWDYSHFVDANYVMQSTIANRIMTMQVSGVFMRFKYYGVWKISESVCILSGLGYSGTHPPTPPTISQTTTNQQQDTWTSCQNVNISALETSSSPVGILSNWNMFVNAHLHKNVYTRLRSAGVATPVANAVTKAFSALWHGFYPGYYLTFGSAAFMSVCAGILRRELRPLVAVVPDKKKKEEAVVDTVNDSHASSVPVLAASKSAYDVAGWALSQLIMNYICAPFPLFWLKEGLAVWASVYYFGHVGMAFVFLYKWAGLFTWFKRFAQGSSSKAKQA